MKRKEQLTMNKKLVLLGITSAALLAVSAAVVSSNNLVALQADTPRDERTVTFTDFNNNNFSLYGGDDYWAYNSNTGNYLGLHGNKIVSATNTSIVLDDGEGDSYLCTQLVTEITSERKYQIALVTAFTITYSGGKLKYDVGGGKVPLNSGVTVELASPKSSVSFENYDRDDTTITSIVIKYSC